MRTESPAHATASTDNGLRVYGCLLDPRARARLQLALRGRATIEWFDSFALLHASIMARGRMTTVIIGLEDAEGESAAVFARTVRGAAAGTAIVVCCNLGGKLQSMSELALAGVHDVLFSGMNDDGHSARMTIFGACLGGAGDAVMAALGPEIPPPLAGFVNLGVRRPRDLRRVAEVAAALKVPRQTIGRWCRANRFVGPEELLTWIRLLLVAAMLESTDRTLESIAYEMQYGSPSALRNRLRQYTGLTATQLRKSGLPRTMGAFRDRIEAVRAEISSEPDESSVAMLIG